jgi:TATA-binding protein-associated factor
MEELFGPILLHYADSTSMLQKFLAATISEEWAHLTQPQKIGDGKLAQELSARFLGFLQGPLPPAYHEMALSLVRLHVDCQAMLQAFALECRLPVSSIPFLGTEVDITSSSSDPNSQTKVFTLSTAYSAIGPMYDRLKNSLGRTKKKEMAIIVEKREKIVQALERYEDVKKGYDTRVCAAFAAAYISLGSTPDKVSPIVKGIMNGIKVAVRRSS